MTPPLPKLLTMKQAAEALSVSVPMIYKLARLSQLPVVKIMSACRIDPRDLEMFIEQRRGKRAAG
jgi:excisionase family DNA binding protein